MEHKKLTPRQVALERMRGNMIPIPEPTRKPLTDRELAAMGKLAAEYGVPRHHVAESFRVSVGSVHNAVAEYWRKKAQGGSKTK